MKVMLQDSYTGDEKYCNEAHPIRIRREALLEPGTWPCRLLRNQEKPAPPEKCRALTLILCVVIFYVRSEY